MSQENVEVVKRIVEAWSAGNLDAARNALDPDITWHDPPQQPGVMTRHGLAGVEGSIRNWLSAWDDYRYELGQLIDTGEKVLMIGRQYGRGKGSQVEVSSDLFQVWTLRDGKVVEMRMFMDRVEALEAVGLSEQDAHADS
jgi:uncharacterized protein